jgi:hypothetical protein
LNSRFEQGDGVEISNYRARASLQNFGREKDCGDPPMRSPLPGVADPARIRPNERPNLGDMVTQVGALLVVVLALALVAQILVGAPP